MVFRNFDTLGALPEVLHLHPQALTKTDQSSLSR
jgi:hypothetical protein